MGQTARCAAGANKAPSAVGGLRPRLRLSHGETLVLRLRHCVGWPNPCSRGGAPAQSRRRCGAVPAQNVNSAALADESDQKIKKFLHIIRDSPVFPVIYDRHACRPAHVCVYDYYYDLSGSRGKK